MRDLRTKARIILAVGILLFFTLLILAALTAGRV